MKEMKENEEKGIEGWDKLGKKVKIIDVDDLGNKEKSVKKENVD